MAEMEQRILVLESDLRRHYRNFKYVGVVLGFAGIVFAVLK